MIQVQLVYRKIQVGWEHRNYRAGHTRYRLEFCYSARSGQRLAEIICSYICYPLFSGERSWTCFIIFTNIFIVVHENLVKISEKKKNPQHFHHHENFHVNMESWRRSFQNIPQNWFVSDVLAPYGTVCRYLHQCHGTKDSAHLNRRI